MKNIINRFVMIFRIIFDKDVMLFSIPKGLKKGENEVSLITASNNPLFDGFAKSIMEVLIK